MIAYLVGTTTPLHLPAALWSHRRYDQLAFGRVDGLFVDDLEVRFGDIVALNGMSFTLQPGQMLGFLGPNGSGKTTTMRSILGLVSGTQRGQVRWQGRPVDAATRRIIGYMPEERGLYPRMKVLDQVTYFARLAGMNPAQARTAARSWLDLLGLADRYDSRVQDLSHGNQQRVQLSTALVHNPDLLVLDEPFSGLDPIAVTTMSDIIGRQAERGAAVLFSSHQLDLVEGLCDDVVIVNQGRAVATGRVDDLRSRSPWRILRVEGEPFTDEASAMWPPQVPGATALRYDEHSLRARVPKDLDVRAALTLLETSMHIRSFSLEPPPLSDVFAEVVS